ncbi:MAG: CPBP family intramembrane glutamic endopeptidase [Chloroflexota bacterium]|nr:CPBP family intramembrane glutamic endopeptidase [Lentimicrobium sp.]
MMVTANDVLIRFITSVSVLSAAYIFYRFVISDKISTRAGLLKGSAVQVLFHRLAGIILFGVLPFSILLFTGQDYSRYGLTPAEADSYLYVLVLGIIIVPVNYFNARTSANLEMYPQIRKEVWSIPLLSVSAIAWAGYLIAYEFMVRGYLLYSTIPLTGLWPAILINTVIYSLIHVHKGYKEMVASVPLGIVLCYLTWITGNIWTAVLTHIIMALSNEWFSIYLNPSIVVRRIRR